MSDFFAPAIFPEPSAGLCFAGSSLDRQSEHRGADALARALQNPQAQMMLYAGGRVLISFAGQAASPLFRLDEIAPFKADITRAVLLGFQQDAPCLAAPIELDVDADLSFLPDNIKAIDMRSLALQGLLPPRLIGDAAQGSALLAWHGSHQYCSHCGAESHSADGGYKRICCNCAAEHFPRTDPVVIMLAVHGERCLMGRSHGWADNVFSALAGFVDAGETIEDAVRRELAEEAGIATGRVKYHASQPWPFPHSLMIGCYAEALTSDIHMDGAELEDCRWFSRAEVLMALEAPQQASFTAPSKISIACHLMEDWARRQG